MILTPLHYFQKWQKETPQHIFLRQPINDQWHVFTYERAGNEIGRIATALTRLNLPPRRHIAILSKNCAHWIMADLAIMLSGHISVPIYPTLSASGVNQILAHSEAAVLFVGKLDNYASQKSGIPHNVVKICFNMYGSNDGMLWDDLVAKNEMLKTDLLPEAEQLATIMYSSGTTGTPKGVMLSHGAFGLVGDQVVKSLQIRNDDKFISYLPLSHIAERGLMEMAALRSGGSISFIESLDKFAANLQHEMPTIFGGVPRIFLKFQEGVLKKIPQKKLSTLLSIPLVGTMISRSIRKKLGLANARVVVCGAAPTPASLITWFDKLGIKIREAYGMTENTAFSHCNLDRIKLSSVGQPWPGVKVKLGDDNEILINSKALMKGYYKDDQTTSQVFTKDGFLKTGDQGMIDDEGFLFITGRIKDQFKTDKAKFIAPAPIELKLQANHDIDQVCVVGLNLPQPIALITLTPAAKEKPQQEVTAGIAEILKSVNQDLEDYERLQTAVILKTEWTVENALLTPSMKVKRNEIEKIHQPRYLEWYGKKQEVIWEYNPALTP